MKTDTIIFSGPTLSPIEVKELLPQAFCCGPVSCGDIFQALRLSPKNIIIIDGYFQRLPSVWHKEILLAIEHGVMVYGASSMGALRAAELDSFGMIGVGEIYHQYRSGEIIDDDEVAVTHGLDDVYTKTGTALINDRFTLRAAVADNIIEADLATELINQLKKQPYYQRSLFVECEKMCFNKLLNWFQKFYIDQKRNDAVELLTAFKSGLLQQNTTLDKATTINNTVFSKKIYREICSRPFKNFNTNLPESETIAFLSPWIDHKVELVRLAKILHIVNDINGIFDKDFLQKIDFENKNLLQIFKNYLIYINNYKSDLICSFKEKFYSMNINLKISFFISYFMSDVIKFIEKNNTTVSAIHQQKFFDYYRKENYLFSFSAIDEWRAKNNLQTQNDLQSFVYTMSLFHCLIENNNVDYLGIKTSMNYTNWFKKAMDLIMDSKIIPDIPLANLII